MTADAAHVAAVLRATALHQHRGAGQRKWDGTAWMCRCGEWVTDWNRHRATVAVETLTPLIRAQVALTPGERLALTVARAQVERGEAPMSNVASVCVMALARIAEATR